MNGVTVLARTIVAVDRLAGEFRGSPRAASRAAASDSDRPEVTGTRLTPLQRARRHSGGCTLPFDCALTAISFWRSTVSAAIASSSQRRASRIRSELSSRSSCLISAAKSKRPAIANDSSGTSASGASTADAGQLGETVEQRQRTLDVGRLGGVVLVVDRLHAAGYERTALRQLEQPESCAPLDEDVQPPVLEPLDDLGDRGQRADLAKAVIVGVDDAERAAVLEAFPDQLAVAGLEDVQRHLLGGQQHEAEREEADLRHRHKPTCEAAESLVRVSRRRFLGRSLSYRVDLKLLTKGRHESDRLRRPRGDPAHRSWPPAEGGRPVISRAHGRTLSVLLGAAAATGAYALIATAHLGDAQTKPEVVSSRQIAQRARKLDAWETSLQKTLKARPPALPPLNRYAAVTFVAAPGATTLPTPAPVTPRWRSRRSRAQSPPRRRPRSRLPGCRRSRSMRSPLRFATTTRPKSATPVAAPVRSATDPATPPAVVVAAAPTPAPAAAAPSSPATLSVEQQCRLLLRAAENKSEQVKQEAERQCEALKNAAERKG